MVKYIMTDAEKHLAEIIWEAEPLGSGELVKLTSQRLGWKKSTTYTVLHKLCKNGGFQNKGAVVTSKISKEEYSALRQKNEQSLKENSNNFSSHFAAVFPKRKRRNENDIKELVTLVGEHQNEEVYNDQQKE